MIVLAFVAALFAVVVVLFVAWLLGWLPPPPIFMLLGLLGLAIILLGLAIILLGLAIMLLELAIMLPVMVVETAAAPPPAWGGNIIPLNVIDIATPLPSKLAMSGL